MTIRKTLFITIYSLCILIVIELLSFWCLEESERYPLLYKNSASANEVFGMNIFSIDLLLGWRHSEQNISSPYNTKDGLVCLRSIEDAASDTLKILITGGSTSDLIFDESSWPVHLFHLLKEQYSVEVYVAAVGGYNSGQELLKTLDFLLDHKPDIHISYSGANEVNPQHSGYVTEYERNVINNLIHGVPYLLPNTFAFGRKFAGRTSTVIIPAGSYEFDQTIYWRQNMKSMNALAQAYQYTFIGVLQPVLGIGPNEYDEKDWTLRDGIPRQVVGFREFYPVAIDFAHNQKFMADFTSIFKSPSTEVFMDDCHLFEKFQFQLSDSIFSLVNQRIPVATL